jgi:hypothetical protein
VVAAEQQLGAIPQAGVWRYTPVVSSAWLWEYSHRESEYDIAPTAGSRGNRFWFTPAPAIKTVYAESVWGSGVGRVGLFSDG